MFKVLYLLETNYSSHAKALYMPCFSKAALAVFSLNKTEYKYAALILLTHAPENR